MSAAVAAAASSPMMITRSQRKAELYEMVFNGRKWRISDKHSRITVPVMLQTVSEEKKAIRTKRWSDENKQFYAQIKKNRGDLTAQFLTKLYGKNQKLGPTYQEKIYNADFPKELTKEFATEFFRLGCNKDTKEQWMDKFAENATYIVSDLTSAHGKEAIKEHLRTMFRGSPDLTFTMYDLKCTGNMAVAVLGNNLNDGNSFLLTSIDFFNEQGECILNIDCYNFFSAAAEVTLDLIHVPKDALQVAQQQLKGLKEQFKSFFNKPQL